MIACPKCQEVPHDCRCASPSASPVFLPALPPGIVAEMREWLRHAESDDGAQTLANADVAVRDWADRLHRCAQLALAGEPTPPVEATPRCGCGKTGEYSANDGGWCCNKYGIRCAPPVEASGREDDRVLWGVVANAGRLANERKVRWSHVSDATGQGSTRSADLCRRFGFDPNETIGNWPEPSEDEDATPSDEPKGNGNG